MLEVDRGDLLKSILYSEFVQKESESQICGADKQSGMYIST